MAAEDGVMSMAICKCCHTHIDTDDDPAACIEHKYGDFFMCEPCREREEHYRALGDKAAAEAEEIEAQRHMEEGL